MSNEDYIIDNNNNKFHKTVIKMNNVSVGYGNYFGPYCVIHENVTIGDGNIFESHCSIGSPAEHKALQFNRNCQPQTGFVKIGSRNHIREFVTINKPTEKITEIGENCMMLTKSHLGHDGILMDNVTLACGVMIGGHSVICEYTTIGLNSAIHQRKIVPPLVMIGMNSCITKKIKLETAKKYAGNPARLLGNNLYAVNGNKVSVKEVEERCISELGRRNIKGWL